MLLNQEKEHLRISKPLFVFGAVIELGTCLDFLDHSDIDFVKEVYDLFVEYLQETNSPLPVNSSFNSKANDLMKRELYCAVVSHAKELAKLNEISIDTVRASFQEGDPIYPSANFHDKTFIQIAVVNPKCIKGIYLPSER